MSDQEKEAALDALRERQRNRPKQIDDASLHAGSPMHFYCRQCGHLAGTLPESYDPRVTPPPRYCAPCLVLIEKGWIDGLD